MAQIPWLRGRSGLAVALFSLLVVVLIGSSLRGYHATTWGWCVPAFAWIAGPWWARARRQPGRAQLGLGPIAERRRRLCESARLRPDDWRIWYDLGIASTGSQRQRAPVRAATLNPLEDDIGALRERGYRLPAGRATR